MPEEKVTLRESAREMAVKRLRVEKTVQNPEVSHMGNKRNAAGLTAQEVFTGGLHENPWGGRKLVVSEKCGLAMGEASEASGSSVSKGP